MLPRSDEIGIDPARRGNGTAVFGKWDMPGFGTYPGTPPSEEGARVIDSCVCRYHQTCPNRCVFPRATNA